MQGDSLYLYANNDSIRLYLKDSLLVADTRNIRPLFLSKDKDCKEVLTFSQIDELYNGESFIEFPEWDTDELMGVNENKLNDSYSIRIKRIPQSEYMVRKWEAASLHIHTKPYKVVTDIIEASDMLGDRMQLTELTLNDGNLGYYVSELTFKDGTKMPLDWEFGFQAYYPELGIVYLIGGHEGDYAFDLNDRKKDPLGNPEYDVTSPDKQLRLCGYYTGQDCVERFLERWSKTKKRYEFIGYLWGSNSGFDFCYTDGWFWVSNTQALFRKEAGWASGYYELEVVKR